MNKIHIIYLLSLQTELFKPKSQNSKIKINILIFLSYQHHLEHYLYIILMKIFVLACLLALALTVKPPTPLCRSSPLPSQIPITVGE